MNPYRTNAYDAGDGTPPPRWYKRRVPNWVSALVIGMAVLTGSIHAATPALRVNGLKFGANDNTIYLAAYGCKFDGVTDDTACWQSAAAALVAGNTLMVPAGTSLTADTVTITKDNVHIVGMGVKSTILKFNPASGKAALKVDNGGGVDRTYGGSIEGIYFQSGNTTIQKIAIDLVDTSGYTIRDVWVDPSSSATPPWRGAGSVGIRARGRELTLIDNVRLWADTPILVDVDPYISTPVSCDHFTLTNSYLLSTPGGGNANFKINDNIIVTNFQIHGDNAWIVDKYGLFWVETGGTSTVAANINMRNIRMEQAQDATGFSIYIDHTKGIQNISINNIETAIAQNGIHLGSANITEVVIANSLFPTNDATKKHLEIPGGVKDLRLDNDYFQINTLATTTGLSLMWAMPKTQSAMALPPTAWYTDSTTASTVAETLSPVQTVLNNSFINTAALNTNLTSFDYTNACTGANHGWGFKTGGSEVAYVNCGGTGVFASTDTPGATQYAVGAASATSVALGRAGGSGVFISAPTIACGSAGGCTSGGSGLYYSTTNSRHYAGSGTAPGAPSAGTGCNTSSGPAITGTDSSGTVGIVCGGTGATASTVFTVLFNTTWSGAPRCILYGANAATAAIPVAQQLFTSASTTTLTVTSNSTGLAAGTYSWFYKCEQ